MVIATLVVPALSAGILIIVVSRLEKDLNQLMHINVRLATSQVFVVTRVHIIQTALPVLKLGLT